MTSEFLEGALAALDTEVRAAAAGGSEPRPALARARRLTEELLELVGRARDQAAQLEREREALHHELERLRAEARERAVPPEGSESTEGPRNPHPRGEAGDLRRALAPVLASKPRRRAPLMALLGGEGA